MGRTDALRELGRVADFCPFCRGFRPFRLFAIENVRHFYHFPLGGRKAVGFSRRCESCGLGVAANQDTYSAISSDSRADIDALIAETNPEIRRNWASRLMLEDRIKSRKLTSGERAELLREPFEMAEAVLARRSSEGRLDLPSRLGCLGTFLLPTLCLTVLPVAWNASGETIEWMAIAFGGLCLAIAFLAIMTDGRRYARREIVPRLVSSLRPLDPNSEEIEAIFESLRQSKATLAEFLDARQMTNALLDRWD
ncbi:hypothetical protein P12x_001498 [Tundrisphaera lichenicola]|uniref:hypothetical protein n=1 Tax=Tundrisphaera lichenicola TaxID=2029860 RepID=UPI003EBB61C9